MPSAPVYVKRRKYKMCPRCGKRVKAGVLCKKHRLMAKEEKAREYQNKVIDRICVWSGCSKPAEPNRRMCKGHLTDNRYNKLKYKQDKS